MHTAPQPIGKRRLLSSHLFLSLATHLNAAGVRITVAPLAEDLDATWTADTATLTLRDDADLSDEDDLLAHVAVLGDLVRMITLQEASRLAETLDPPRHLQALPDPA